MAVLRIKDGLSLPGRRTAARTFHLLQAWVAVSLFTGLGVLGGPAVVGWGDNSMGQAAAPPTLPNLTAIAAGGFFSLGLGTNGIVYAWGAGSAGQTNIPANLTGVAAISAGYSHGLALRTN